jgi:hypothetical protein
MAHAADAWPYVCGLIILAGTWLAIGSIWLRQRALEHRVDAVWEEHRRARLVAEVLREYGPSRGDAE